MTDKDRQLLIEVHSDVKLLRKDFENHLQDHKKYMLMAWTTCIGLIITLVTILLK